MGLGTNAYIADSQAVNLNKTNINDASYCSKNTDDSQGSWLGRMVKSVMGAVKTISKTVLPDLIFLAGFTVFIVTGSAAILLPAAVFYIGVNVIRLVDTIEDIRRLHSTRP